MYHTIEFTRGVAADLEISRKQPMERVRLRAGTPFRAQIKPYVVETTQGPIEVADLFFEDGTATRMMPFAFFKFVE
jgi:hypothetical protein